MKTNVQDLCVVGAGISGLSLAAFSCPEQSVCIIDSKPRVGGILAKTVYDNSIFDNAANGWLDNEPSVEELISRINQLENIQPANTEGATRYLVKDDTLYALSPRLLFRNTPLISWREKFRALTEIFRGNNISSEPSIAEWMSHRFGSGVVDNFVAPMCAGIYASTPESISLPAAFPNLWNKTKNGSIIIQFFKQLITNTRPKQPRLTSFKGGTVELCNSIEQWLRENGARILLNSPVQKIEWDGEIWTINTPDQTIFSRKLALTCPAPVQAQLLDKAFPKIAKTLSQIKYSPVAVVLQQFDQEQFTQTPSGFGALLTRKEQQSGLLGILFSSYLFPNKAASKSVCTRSILGGSIVPKIVDKTDSSLQELALNMHRKLFNSPYLTTSFVKVLRWKQAIPQYNKGHLDIQHQVQHFHIKHPHIRLSGNHLFGVAIKDCIRIGKEHSNHFKLTNSN